MAELKINKPAWLASEVGLRTKTYSIPSNFGTYASETDADGLVHKVVKSGTILTTPFYGLVYDDVDITGGAAIAAIVVSGLYIDAKLPTTAASYVSNFAATGLFPFSEGSVTRTFTAPATLTTMTMGIVTATNAVLSWTAVTGAVKYEVYTSATSTGTFTYDGEAAQAASPSYTVTATGYYKVKAIGDNLFYLDSAMSAAAQVSSLT